MTKHYWIIGGLTMAFVALISLGVWQIHRYEEKKYLQQLYQDREKAEPISLEKALTLVDPLFMPVVVSGGYVPSKTVLLMHQRLHLFVGFNVYTPFVIAGTHKAILVDRGWIRAPSGSTFQYDELLGKLRTQIKGYLVALNPRFILGDAIVRSDEWPLMVQTLNLPLLEKKMGFTLYPYVLRLAPGELGMFRPNWTASVLKPEKHLVYAVQWFLLALVLLIGMIIVRRKNKENRLW